jgi:hypothetical protein
MLSTIAFFRGSPLLTMGPTCFVTLSLIWADPPTYLYSNDLLQWLLCVPQLEKLQIGFNSPPLHKMLSQMSGASIMAHIMFPNLWQFGFEGPIV